MTDYTDLIARLQRADEYEPVGHDAWEAAAAIAALTAERDALQAQVREMALDVLAASGQAQEAYRAQIVAEAERDALRGAIIDRLHHYDEDTGEDRCGCGACAPLFAALTSPPQKA